MKKFLQKEEGLVTIEWVGLSAVMVLAAIAIVTFVMEGADGAAGTVDAGLQTVDASNPNITPANFGNGMND